MESPLNDLLTAIGALERDEPEGEIAHARPDLGREDRKGIPEVILADTKSAEQVIRIAEAFVASRGRAILSRVPAALQAQIEARFAEESVSLYPASGMVVIRAGEAEQPRSGGRVGVITAGTSDLAVAEQAVVVAREMGCEVELVSDVGVAGLHRLFSPLQRMLEVGVDVVVVAAGMDGALPSVVSGLVDVPVIGLPVSTGYGFGGKGVAALLSMLQTCAPGLTVVNIDNGVGAGATAGLIANRCARARGASTRPPDTRREV